MLHWKMPNEPHPQLDEQKQENLLKETIDRVRVDVDEMQSNAAVAVTGAVKCC